MNTSDISPKSRLVALLLCFFLGPLGVHRFYVGKIGTGILMLLTLGGAGHLGADRPRNYRGWVLRG